MTNQWDALAESDIAVLYSPVTAAELWRGVRHSETPVLENLLASLQCLTLDGETGRMAGDMMREFARSHNLSIRDALIAATAIQYGAQLWTRNRKHFPSKKIRFYNPERIH